MLDEIAFSKHVNKGLPDLLWVGIVRKLFVFTIQWHGTARSKQFEEAAKKKAG